jgi:hypothetical protein
MKGLSVVIAGVILVFGAVTSGAANLEKISAATGVPVATLQAERAATGLGWGSLENAHLLANASGQSFDNIVALHKSGEGWGKIAHDNGLNLGRLVSDAHRSSQATMHSQSSQTVHGKSATKIGRGHTVKTTTTRSVGQRSGFRSGFNNSIGMHSMGHISRSRGIGSAGHGGRRGR